MALVKWFFYLTSDVILFYFTFAVFSSFITYSNSASEIKRPRGVSISKASLYIPDKDFACFDGSYVIPFLQVNDDYCDCPDGSDEPGTSACPNSFFHCTNAGFKPLNIPSSQVSDGVCDCCDGADEYLGKVNCPNICYELGKAERMEAQKQAEITKIGYQTKLQLIIKGKQLKQEKKEKLKQLELDKQEAENIKMEKEKFKLEVEELEKIALEEYNKVKQLEEQKLKEEAEEAAEKEAFDIFNLLDSNEDRKIQISELQVRQTFDQNRDGIVSEEEGKFFLDNNEELDWGKFLSSGWPKMKPFFMMEKGLFKPPESNFSKTENEIISNVGDGIGTVEDVPDEYQKEKHKTEEEVEALEQEEAEEEEDEEEEEVVGQTTSDAQHKAEESQPQYDEETQKLVNAANDARSEFEEADRAVRDIQRQISQYQEYLEKDFGPEEEFAPLEGQCFEYTDREYVYKLCPFDQAVQQPRSGESEVRLGQWSKWLGSEDNKYAAMLYDKGQSCWNGPQRSTVGNGHGEKVKLVSCANEWLRRNSNFTKKLNETMTSAIMTVKLKCGIGNVITSVTEPNKCEYHFEFTTPSACRMAGMHEEKIHDEL